jgi:hypothetical protein
MPVRPDEFSDEPEEYPDKVETFPDEAEECKVGYRKPPKSGQFKKGESGNPSGRPKGSKSLANIIWDDSMQLVKVSGKNGSRWVTKLEAIMQILGNEALKGNTKAAREYFRLAETHAPDDPVRPFVINIIRREDQEPKPVKDTAVAERPKRSNVID